MSSLSRAPLLVLALAAGLAFLDPDRTIRSLSRFDHDDLPELKPGVPVEKLKQPHPSGVKTKLVPPFALVIQPEDAANAPDSTWLKSWLAENDAWFKEAFFQYGAIIFRGFNIGDPASFERVALAVNTDLATVYLGTSPRSGINGTTYVHTAADFQPHRTVPVHLEMSFRKAPPQLQIFFAYKMDQEKGGETPLTDFQGVWDTLKADPDFQRRYETSMLTYVRNNDDCSSLSKVDPLVQKCWQEMFKTDDRTAVLGKCASEEFECSWDEHNRLTMVNSMPFVRKHPVTGNSVWFNHINVLHKDSMALDYERTAALWGGSSGLWPLVLGLYYRALYAALGFFVPETQLGSTATFQDGQLIPAEDFRAFKRAIWRNTVQQPYEVNDIVIVDNMRVGHGREIYTGPKMSRQVMTAWSDLYPSGWVQGSN